MPNVSLVIKSMLMRKSEHVISRDPDRVHGRFKWLYPVIVGGIVGLLVAAMIYDALSGLDPNTVMRTGVVESLYSSSGYAERSDVLFTVGASIAPVMSRLGRLGRLR